MAGRRTIISTEKQPSDKISSIARLRGKFLSQKSHRKSKRPNLAVFGAYGGVFAFIISVIAVGYQPPQPTSSSSAVVTATQTPTSTPDTSDNVSVDELVAIDFAAKLASETDMFVAVNVAYRAEALESKVQLAQTSDIGIVKPQIVQPTASSNEAATYVVKEGDTVDTIAALFGVKAETIRWANDLVGSAVAVGRTLTIPAIDGVLYTVRSGDTVDSVARAYTADKNRIISINNLELSGLKPGEKIMIPNGSLPVEQRPGYVAPPRLSYSYQGGYGSWSGLVLGMQYQYTPSNGGYAAGNCTVYAFNRRAQMGRPIPTNLGNAISWANNAAGQGYRVNNTPAPGAVIQSGNHVGIVEEVYANGDIRITDMNYLYRNHWVAERVIPASTTGSYRYIH